LKISEDKRHILYLRAPEGASKMHIQPVQDIEQELNIDTLDRTNFFPTDEKRITYIEMSKFWLASPMRLSVFSSVFKARGYVGPYFDTDLKKEFLAKFKSGCVNTAIHYNPDFGIFENLKLLPDVSKLICR
jgi:hypothetical protein